MSQIIMNKGAEPPTPQVGFIVVYADSGTGILRYKKSDGTVHDLVGQNDPELKAITVELPGLSDNVSFFDTDVAITIYKIRAVVVGTTPSLTWTLRHGTDRSAAGAELITGGTTTTNQTTGQEITTFNDATVVANSHLWLTFSAKSGVVNSFSLTIYYNED